MFNRPVRKIKPKTKGYRGKEPFLKTGEMIPWESFLERDYIRLADYDLDVQLIFAQNIKITYMYDGKIREHYPDFKIITYDNQVFVVEVKPNRFVFEKGNPIKYLAGRAYCEERDWTYITITEDDIRPGYLQPNLSLLRGLGMEEVPSPVLDFVVAQLEKVNVSTIAELRVLCAGLTEEQYYSAIYQLIYFQEVHSDLISTPITDFSQIEYRE